MRRSMRSRDWLPAWPDRRRTGRGAQAGRGRDRRNRWCFAHRAHHSTTGCSSRRCSDCGGNRGERAAMAGRGDTLGALVRINDQRSPVVHAVSGKPAIATRRAASSTAGLLRKRLKNIHKLRQMAVGALTFTARFFPSKARRDVVTIQANGLPARPSLGFPQFSPRLIRSCRCALPGANPTSANPMRHRKYTRGTCSRIVI